MAAEKPESPDHEADKEQSNKELVLHDELLIKHPLQNKWTLWFYKNDKNKDWAENLCEITSFDTVEDFWALYNHIEVASNLGHGCDYSLFKYGIKPMWEDDRNKEGGRWLINLSKGQRERELDNYWLETILCLVGESFDDVSDDVCGAVVNIRNKGDKISVWAGDAKRQNDILKIGKKLKEVLQIAPRVFINFEAHSDTKSKASSSIKGRLRV